MTHGEKIAEPCDPKARLSTEPPAPELMEVVRTPTPLPDFYIDEYGVEQPKDYLHTSTIGLNIEELEPILSVYYERITC